MSENLNDSITPNIIKGCMSAIQVLTKQASELVENDGEDEDAPSDMISSLTSLASKIEKATDLNLDGYTTLDEDITIGGLSRKCEQLRALLEGCYSQDPKLTFTKIQDTNLKA